MVCKTDKGLKEEAVVNADNIYSVKKKKAEARKGDRKAGARNQTALLIYPRERGERRRR